MSPDNSFMTGQLLFIDGDHTYCGVKSDYEMYAPLTAPPPRSPFTVVPGTGRWGW